MKYQCLDLFSGLEGFSQAFQESAEWRVTTIDIEERFTPDIQADVMELRPTDLFDRGVDPDLVLASPPCTQFSTAGNHDKWDFDTQRPTHPDSREAIALVYHTLGLIHALTPDYWYLENPMGRLRWYLGKPTGMVTYCQYGRPYMKRTDLWGRHPPMNYRRCKADEPCHHKNVEYDGTSATRILGDNPAERAKVPRQLSQQIHDTVTDALQHTPPQQITLTTAAPDGGDA